MNAGKPDQSTVVEIEFTLALNNRTGRYFMCRELIHDLGRTISQRRYWRIASQNLPSGLYARVLGRMALWELRTRIRHRALDSVIPRMRSSNPIVFTDPLHVALYQLKPEDTVIVYDMGPVTHPECYGPGVFSAYRKTFHEIATVRPHLIFISNSSRAEYERLHGSAYSSAKVVYPGLRTEVSTGEAKPVEGVKQPFLLTVGSVGLRKNQLRVIDAFEKSGLVERGYSYVLCGGPEPGFEQVVSKARDLPWVQFTGYATDAQLRWLYAHAEGFVLPSLLEGFGIPAAEAIVRGLLPLVSKGGALNEITGNCAILVDPLDISSIAAGLRELVSLSAGERLHRLAIMREHLAFFTPENTRTSWQNAILGELQASR